MSSMPAEQRLPACDLPPAAQHASAITRPPCSRQRSRGLTLLEILLGVMIVAVLAAMGMATYNGYKAKIKVSRAITDIVTIQTSVAAYVVDNQKLPNALSDVSAQLGAMVDPWGHGYQYLNHTDIAGAGLFRKDKNIVPINSDYDLWSMGPDGSTVPPLTAAVSRDDIVRANNARFIGTAAEYDP